MDASCVITQVARDEEQSDSVKDNTKNGSVDGKKKNGSIKSRSANSILKRLFSCCWKSPSNTDEAENYPASSSSHSGSSEATQSPNNGVCVAEDCVNYPSSTHLLPPIQEKDLRKKCMIIDLDETLVHSSFKPISNADFVVPVEIDGTVHQVYVLKRPQVDDFLQKVGELYECVLFTASLAKYADPVADLLDKWGVFRARLFRESCVFHRGNYVKDLSRLGRDLHKVVIMDNSPASYVFHPDNAVPVSSWFDDMTDSELLDLLPFLETLSHVDSVYSVLRNVSPSVMTHLVPINNNLDADNTSSSPLLQATQQPQQIAPSSSIITQVAPPISDNVS